MLGVSVGLLAFRRRSRQRHFKAIPASIAASLDPVVEVPVASSSAGEFQSRLNMFTHRCSRSAVRGYSSLSIMFLSKVSAISRVACGSIHVVTNVARFSRAFPSSISSSCTIWYASSGTIPLAGSSCRAMRTGTLVHSGFTETCDRPRGRGCESAMPTTVFAHTAHRSFRTSGQAGAKLAFEDLSGGGDGELVDEVDLAEVLVGDELVVDRGHEV